MLPTLLFIAQLEGVPKEFEKWEAKALGAMSKGPRGWNDAEMFKSLKEWFGMPMNAKNLDQIANASKVRVAVSENWSEGGIHHGKRADRLDEWVKSSNAGRLGSLHWVVWKEWYENAHVKNINKSEEDIDNRGKRLKDLSRELKEKQLELHIKKGRPGAMERWKVTGAQAEAMKYFEDDRRGVRCPLTKWLKRWEVGLWEVQKVERAARVVSKLHRLVAPRVVAAVIRTWHNAWCTRRRYQEGYGSRCIFGCGKGEDSIEHYACCGRIAEWSRRALGLPGEGESIEVRRRHFLLLNGEDTDDNEMTRAALRLGAVYSLHNRVRHGVRLRVGVETEALRQSIMDMAEGCRNAERCLNCK